jgi:hypothetical protein
MRTEIKDVDPRDASAFLQDILDYLEINESQVPELNQVLRTHGLRAEIRRDDPRRRIHPIVSDLHEIPTNSE